MLISAVVGLDTEGLFCSLFCLSRFKFSPVLLWLKDRNDVRQHGIYSGIQNGFGNVGLTFSFLSFDLISSESFCLDFVLPFYTWIYFRWGFRGAVFPDKRRCIYKGDACQDDFTAWQAELWYHNSMLGKTIPSFFYTRERKPKEDLTDFKTCSNILLSN